MKKKTNFRRKIKVNLKNYLNKLKKSKKKKKNYLNNNCKINRIIYWKRTRID